MTTGLELPKYYRLPWSMTDNGISWLEVTARCNLTCEGCYRETQGARDKTLDEIAADLRVFRAHRKSDCMSIAGGDPLVHPRIVEIVSMVRECGWKPVINTNGVALTPALLRKLKNAGLAGFTFHIDTSQKRPDSGATTEAGLNPLRQQFAERVAAEGGLACSFNQTVTSDTVSEVADVVRWALRYPDIVHTVVFILYREPRMFGEFDFFVQGRRIPLADTYKKTRQWGGDRPLSASDLMRTIREVDPTYEPCAYLNGTEDPASAKWLLATRVATRKRGYGYVSPFFMQAVQTANRFFRGRWLSYSSPAMLSSGFSGSLATAPVDRRMRKIFLRQLLSPSDWFSRRWLQTFTVIQPIDILPDGRMNMCDSCPDITVHEGKLVWSCRLEELKRYGAFANAAPRSKALTAASLPSIPESSRERSSIPLA